MDQPMSDLSPRLKARIAGGLYLIVIVGGVFAELFVRGRLFVAGDVSATAHNIQAHELLYRFGFVVEVFYCACNVPLTLIFYDLFKIVSRNVAALDLCFTLVANTIESVSLLLHFAPVVLLGGAFHAGSLTADQLQAWAYLSLELFEYGFAICLVFFGFSCLAMAYLILRSTFFPRVIGALLAIEGLCYLIESFAKFLAPQFATRFLPVLEASAIGEIALCLWLLIMGVNVQRWTEQARASAVPATLGA